MLGMIELLLNWLVSPVKGDVGSKLRISFSGIN
jgi:hypothetical protein